MPLQSLGAQDPAGQFMRSFGVARTPNRSAAEQLAIQKASARGSQGAIPQEQLAQHQAIHDLTDQLRSGQITNQQIVQALRQGSVTRQQAERILKESQMTPLAARIQNLPLADSLDVYQLATSQEKAELRQLMLKKVEEFGKTQANRNAQTNAYISSRIQRILGLHLGVPTHQYVGGTVQPIQ